MSVNRRTWGGPPLAAALRLAVTRGVRRAPQRVPDECSREPSLALLGFAPASAGSVVVA